MISLWLFAFLFHSLGVDYWDWYYPPLVLTGALFALVEIIFLLFWLVERYG